MGLARLNRNLTAKSPQQRQRNRARQIPRIVDASRNTYELMRQIPEYGGHVSAASILIDASERRLRFMLLASVKSAFPRGFDVGSIIWPHGETCTSGSVGASGEQLPEATRPVTLGIME